MNDTSRWFTRRRVRMNESDEVVHIGDLVENFVGPCLSREELLAQAFASIWRLEEDKRFGRVVDIAVLLTVALLL